jgi:hypothetical protein
MFHVSMEKSPLEKHIAAIRTAFDQVRQHVRPEGDAAAGALSVAIDQAAAAADQADQVEVVKEVQAEPVAE